MKKISIIGLGYVGLPLAIEFAKEFNVIGYDISKKRVNELKKGIDSNDEFQSIEILKNKLKFTKDEDEINNSDFFIITVPTPLKKNNKPDLRPLKDASILVASKIKKGNIVVYESTVYPGCTEEDCIPIIEKHSGLKYNVDFFCGYSPERINPGDKKRKLSNIKKVVSGSNKETALKINKLYSKIVKAGTFLAPSIKVAEAAKIIENVQRDVNISLMNEFALIFEKLNIDTKEVIDAASTKWNFLNFKPGLVGGHCIGIDPYYLSYKAEQSGYKPKVILNGRKVNDNISKNIFRSIEEKCKKSNINLKKCKILILGITFKENCSDIRNSNVVKLYNHFKKINTKIDVYDPKANKIEVLKKFKIKLINNLKPKYSVVILAVAHNIFMKLNYKNLLDDKYILYDVKSVLPKKIITLRL